MPDPDANDTRRVTHSALCLLCLLVALLSGPAVADGAEAGAESAKQSASLTWHAARQSSRSGQKVAPSFPPASALPSRPELPDPLVMLDGRRVATREQWFKERQPDDVEWAKATALLVNTVFEDRNRPDSDPEANADRFIAKIPMQHPKRSSPSTPPPCGSWLLRALLLKGGLVALGGVATVANAADTRAVRADDFLQSLGANSAVSRRGERLTNTISAARFLGLRWFRVGHESGIPVTDLLKLHEETGVRFSYGLMSGGTDLSRLLEGARQLAAAGALIALEGNNEPNNWGVTYEGVRGGRTNSWLPVAKLQRDLYQAVKSDPMLKDYPVWSLSENGAQTDNVGLQFLTIPAGAGTLMPDGTCYADYANCHNYLTHPSWPGLHDNQTWIAADPGPACRADGLHGNYGRTWRRRFPGYSESDLQTLPRVTTETGVTIGGPFTEQVQALLYLSTYLDQFKRGWKHTAIYLLRDRTDEAGNQTFGFYQPDYTPRLAATYLHNLTTILADTPSAEPPGSLDYSIPNPPATVHDLLLQKRDGQFELVIWNERFTGGADEVTVKLAKPAASVTIFDPTAGTAPARRLTDVAAITLTLSNHPVIIEMSSQAPQRADIIRLIHLAGTTHHETERLRLLRELDARVDLDATLRADLTRLLPVVDDWADGKSRVNVDHSRAAENGYLCRFFSGRVRAAGEGAVYPPELSPGSPLRPIWAFYRGRMLIWQVIQSSPLLSPGDYRLILTGTGTDNATPLQQRAVHVEGPRVRVSLELPARRLCLVKVSRQ